MFSQKELMATIVFTPLGRRKYNIKFKASEDLVAKILCFNLKTNLPCVEASSYCAFMISYPLRNSIIAEYALGQSSLRRVYSMYFSVRLETFLQKQIDQLKEQCFLIILNPVWTWRLHVRTTDPFTTNAALRRTAQLDWPTCTTNPNVSTFLLSLSSCFHLGVGCSPPSLDSIILDPRLASLQV